MSEEALHPKQVIVLEAGYIYKRPTDNEYHQGLELDTNSKGVQAIRYQSVPEGSVASFVVQREAPRRRCYNDESIRCPVSLSLFKVSFHHAHLISDMGKA
jgi:hypothetical protein